MIPTERKRKKTDNYQLNKRKAKYFILLRVELCFSNHGDSLAKGHIINHQYPLLVLSGTVSDLKVKAENTFETHRPESLEKDMKRASFLPMNLMLCNILTKHSRLVNKQV